MFLHHQLFQESCCNVRDPGLARACVMDLYLESDEPYQLRRWSQRGGTIHLNKETQPPRFWWEGQACFNGF